MKSVFLLVTNLAFGGLVVAQTQLSSGVILPNNNKGVTLLPTGNSKILSNSNQNKTITANLLPKGTYATPKGAILILPNNKEKTIAEVVSNDKPSLTTNNGLPSLLGSSSGTNNNLIDNNTVAGNGFLPPLNTTPNNNPVNSSISQQPLAPLTSLINNNSAQQVSTNTNNYTQQELPPLTALPSVSYSTPKGSVISGAYTTNKFNTNTSVGNSNMSQSTTQYSMPPLASIPNARNSNTVTQSYTMPPLASLEGTTTNTTNNQSSMPALAPIEGVVSNNNKSVPELAPLKLNEPKGFALPKGTLLNAKSGTTYTVKPLTPAELNNDKAVAEPVYKPGAGGGMGMPALDPIEETTVTKQEQIPELAAIETTIEKKENVMPALAAIEVDKQPMTYQGQNMQQPQQVKTTYQSKAPTAAKPCIHTDGSYCPCCVQKPVKKWTPKKKWTAKKWMPKKAAKVVYVHQPQIIPAQQPVKANQRVTYLPNQPKAVNQQMQPQTLVQQPVKQPQEKVVYTDYTKAYYKEPEKPACNCPGNTNNSNNNNPQKYYNPTKYAGLNAGPTSGDYPVANAAPTNDQLKYKFYVNQRGKYSVEIYNHAFSAFLQQDGTLKEYRFNGDAANSQPKMNYFSKPESLAGTPIVYNYNRTVNKIGNVKLEYDFEGFIKTIDGNTVLYTSRSSLSGVNGIRVQYDGSGNVTGVDSNDGIIQYTGN